MNYDTAKLKVAKLMAMAHDARGNENEAEAALRQAAWLMREHGIEQAEIEQSTGTTTRWDWAASCIPLNPTRYSANLVTWLGQLGVGIARLTDTIVDYQTMPTYGTCIRFRGEASDVAFSGYLMKHLRDTVRRMSAAYPASRKGREDYRRAMVARLVERMRTLKTETNAQTEQEAVSSTTASTALAIVERKMEAVAEHFGTQKVSRSSRRSYQQDSYIAGRRDADNVGLGHGVSGPAAQRAIA